MVWGKVKHERKFSIYLLSLALHARIPGRCPSYRSSIGDYHLLYDQVEIDRLKLDWDPAFFDVDTCNSKENPYLISRYFNQNSNLIEGGIVGS